MLEGWLELVRVQRCRVHFVRREPGGDGRPPGEDVLFPLFIIVCHDEKLVTKKILNSTLTNLVLS